MFAQALAVARIPNAGPTPLHQVALNPGSHKGLVKAFEGSFKGRKGLRTAF